MVQFTKDMVVGILNEEQIQDQIDKGILYNNEETYYPEEASTDYILASRWVGGFNGTNLFRFVLKEKRDEYVVHTEYAPTDHYRIVGYGNGDYLRKDMYSYEDAVICFAERLKRYQENNNHAYRIETEWLGEHSFERE